MCMCLSSTMCMQEAVEVKRGLDPLELELLVDVGAGNMQYTCAEVRRPCPSQFSPFALFQVSSSR